MGVDFIVGQRNQLFDLQASGGSASVGVIWIYRKTQRHGGRSRSELWVRS